MTTDVAPDIAHAPDTTPEIVPTYIFCPEEPFLNVWCNGRMLKFNNGRLMSTHIQEDRRALTEDDIAWFKAEAFKTEARGDQPRFIIYDGNIDNETVRAVLMSYLSARVTRQVLNRAQGADAATMAGDIELAMAMMLSTNDGLPDIRFGGDRVIDTINRVQPSMGAQMENLKKLAGGIIRPMADAQAAVRDEQVIQQAAAGLTGDNQELQPPAAKGVDDLIPGGSGQAVGSPWER